MRDISGHEDETARTDGKFVIPQLHSHVSFKHIDRLVLREWMCEGIS